MRTRTWSWWMGATLLWASFGACAGSETRHRLVLELSTDLEPAADFATVQVSYEGPGGEGLQEHEAEPGRDYRDGVPIASLRLRPGSYQLWVLLHDPSEDVFAMQPLHVELDGDRTVTVRIDSECADVTCPGPGDPETHTACRGGECVSPECDSSSPGPCEGEGGEDECSGDDDCVTADDGCLRRRCVEGSCVGEPDDGACPEGQRCEASSGACVSDVECTMDAECDEVAEGCLRGSCDDGTCLTEPDHEACAPDQACSDVGACEPLFPCDEVERIAGPGRYETAVALSQRFFADGADAVVIVRGDTGDSPLGPDGVLAGPLARRRGGPVLLSSAAGLPAAVGDEVTRLGATRADLIGGTAALSEAVEDDLRARGVGTIVRHAGANRFDTAARVAQAAGAPDDRAFVVNGADNDRLVDGLFASAAGAELQIPVLFVTASSVPSDTQSAIGTLGITRTYVIGGGASVSDSVLSELPSPTRISGATRTETAVNVAEMFSAEASSDEVSIVRARAETDGMAAAGSARRFLLLADQTSLPAPTRNFVDAEASGAFLLGGSVVFDEDVERQLCTLLAR